MSEDINENFEKKLIKTKNNYIILECDNCSEENKVNLSSTLKCKKCKKTLLGFHYKTFLLSTITVIGLSGVAGAMIDDSLNLNRASVKTEYKMMRTCLSEFYDRDTCFCAVESMSGFLDAEKARLYGRDKLQKLLKDRYNGCKD